LARSLRKPKHALLKMWRLLRILGDLGRIIRATGFRRGTSPDCHPACPLPDLSPALYGVQKLSRWLLRFTGVTFALSGGVLALGSETCRCPFVPQQGVHALSGGAVLNGLVMLAFIGSARGRTGAGRSNSDGRPYPLAPGNDHSTGSGHRIYSDGAGPRTGAGTTTARHRSDRRYSILHFANTVLCCR
jgi:hypothetical protein